MCAVIELLRAVLRIIAAGLGCAIIRVISKYESEEQSSA